MPGVLPFIHALVQAGADHVTMPPCPGCGKLRSLHQAVGGRRLCDPCAQKADSTRCGRCGLIKPKNRRDEDVSSRRHLPPGRDCRRHSSLAKAVPKAVHQTRNVSAAHPYRELLDLRTRAGNADTATQHDRSPRAGTGSPCTTAPSRLPPATPPTTTYTKITPSLSDNLIAPSRSGRLRAGS